GLGHGPFGVARLPHVAVDGQATTTRLIDAGHGILDGVGVEVHGPHRGALGGEGQSSGPADALARSRHEDHPPVEPSVHLDHPYSPTNRGGRFSLNAAMPSFAS